MGYQADHHIPMLQPRLPPIASFLKNQHPNYDIYHVHFRPFFYNNSKTIDFPSFLDLILLKSIGKKIVFHFRGSEVRINKIFKDMSPYNYVDENPFQLSEKFPDETKYQYIKIVKAISDAVLVNDSEIQSYVGAGTIINRIVPEDKLPHIGISSSGLPLVVHAPSRREVKGTHEILHAVKTLKNEGLKFKFQLIENMNHTNAVEVYKQADIIIDQLRIGWYGVLSVEAMCLGKAVICYIRDDLMAAFNNKKPIMNANTDNITEVLRELILNKEKRLKISTDGRKWFNEQHSEKKVINNLISVYDEVMSTEKPLDFNVCMDFIQYHSKQYNKKLTTINGNTMPYSDIEGWHPKTFYSKAAYILETQGIRSLLHRMLKINKS